jgi:hypothetical protein
MEQKVTYHVKEFQQNSNTAVIQLENFFNQLFGLIYNSKYSQTSLRSDPLIYNWLTNVAKANYHPELTFIQAAQFYVDQKTTYIDIQRSIPSRVMRSAWKTAGIIGGSVLGIGSFCSYLLSERLKKQQQSAVFEGSKKSLDYATQAVEVTNEMTQTSLHSLSHNQQTMSEREAEIQKIRNEIAMYENKHGDNQEKINSLKNSLTEALALGMGASQFLHGSQFGVGAATLLGLTTKAAQNQLETTAKIAEISYQNMEESFLYSAADFVHNYSHALLGGVVLSSVLSLGCVAHISRKSQEKQRQTFNEMLSIQVSQTQYQLGVIDSQRIALARREQAEEMKFTKLIEFNDIITKATKQSASIQINHLMIECKAFKDSYYKIDFMEFYYWIRNYVVSHFGWTEDQCDNTRDYKFFFDVIFDPLDSERGMKKYRETNGKYTADLLVSVPVENFENLNNTPEQTIETPRINVQERRLSHFTPILENVEQEEEKEERSQTKRIRQSGTNESQNKKFKSITTNSIGLKIFDNIPPSPALDSFKLEYEKARAIGRELDFWILKMDSEITRSVWGRQIWGLNWKYLNNSRDYNKENNFCNNDVILSLVSYLDSEQDKLYVTSICKGNLSNVREALLPINKEKLSSDRSTFYYQCYISDKLQPLTQMFIKLLISSNISHQNDPERYRIEFENIILKFIQNSKQLEDSLSNQLEIVFAIRALTPSIIQTYQVDQILLREFPNIQLQLIQFSEQLMSIFAPGKFVYVDPSTKSLQVKDTPMPQPVTFNINFPEMKTSEIQPGKRKKPPVEKFVTKQKPVKVKGSERTRRFGAPTNELDQ